jgi:hypothetical protein
MMMSLSIALRRISVMKQRSNSLHFWPVQASARASSLCQSRLASGSSASSARSPVLVVFSQAAMSRYCSISSKPLRYRLIGEVVQLLAAQIIVAALHVADREPKAGRFPIQRLLDKRNVFVKELLLQIFCSRRNDDAFARPDHGHQVRQRFASSCTGFHNQMPLFVERLLNGLRHLQLAPAEFIRRMRAREHSTGGEELVQRSVFAAGKRPI